MGCYPQGAARRFDADGKPAYQANAMTKLTAASRKSIPTGEFALPGRRYPIEDEAHARNALARVAQDGTAVEKATVRRKVHARYPALKQGS